MQKDIKVIVKKAGEPFEEMVIENELAALQRIVGGYIEVLRIVDKLILIMNEEGKLLGLPINFFVWNDDIRGTVIFAGVAGEDIVDVPYDIRGCEKAVMNYMNIKNY